MPSRPAILFLVTVLLGAARLAASDEPANEVVRDSSFSDRDRVTGIDAVVEVRSTRNDKPIRSKNLSDGDFRVRVDGLERPVISVEPHREPWLTVLYFDRVLSDRASERWAATQLAARAETLTELGAVEIVVAAPEPQVVLEASWDPEEVFEVLSRLSLFPEAEDSLGALRQEFDELSRSELDLDPGELAEIAAREETRLVESQADALTLWIAERRPPVAARGLWLVTARELVTPTYFHRLVGATGGTHGKTPGEVIETLGQTLAAYGWTGFLLEEPGPDPGLEPGLRIGKWRVAPPRGLLLGFRASREDEREPERARALTALGQSHLDAGQAEPAADAFRQAIYHFAGDPRTRDDQATAFLGLAEARRALDDPQAARRAARIAEMIAAGEEGPSEEPLPHLTSLEPLVTDSSGAVVRGESAIDTTLDRLESRVRISYQIEGDAEGRTLPVEIESVQPGRAISASRWTRSGAPPAVAEARLRQAAQPIGEQLSFQVRITPQSDSETAPDRLAIEVFPRETSAGALLRVTVGITLGDALSQITHAMREVGDETDWLPPVEIRHPDQEAEIRILVEEVTSGRWGSSQATARGSS